MNTPKPTVQETKPITSTNETQPSKSLSRTRSGCLPSRHTNPRHTSPLGNFPSPDAVAECGINRKYVKPRPHKRQRSISEAAKDFWLDIKLAEDITNGRWQSANPRVLELAVNDSVADGAADAPRGTGSRPEPRNQGVIGVDTSQGVFGQATAEVQSSHVVRR